jgi:hypothetical protein
MPIIKSGRKKTFQPMPLATKQRLIYESLIKPNCTYDFLAKKTGLSKSQVIAFSQLHNLRPKGNNYATREVKRPLIKARLDKRANDIINYFNKHHGRATITELREEFGGTKLFVKTTIEEARKNGLINF